MSPEEDRTRDAVDSESKHYQLSYSGPQVCAVTALANGGHSEMDGTLSEPNWI